MKLTWYFDFISPFAYLQHCLFDRLPQGLEIEYKPVLLAGLLNHWNNVGPAEIAPKRTFTYKHCYWLAKKMGIEYPTKAVPIIDWSRKEPRLLAATMPAGIPITSAIIIAQKAIS